MTMFLDPCAKCEEMLQPFLDRELSEDEYAIAEAHLNECGYCRKRYKFEETLRRYPTWHVDESRVEWVHTSTVRGYAAVPMRVR